MDAQHYEIVFRGKLLGGADRGQVVERLAGLFGVDPLRVESLLQAPKTVLRRGLDRDTAVRYRETLLAAGVMVAMVGSEAPPEPGLAGAQWRIASLETAVAAAPVRNEAGGGLSLATAGTPIGEKRAFVAPRVNMQGLRLSAANVALDQTPKPAPVQVTAPDLKIEAREGEDKQRSDFARTLMKELRT